MCVISQWKHTTTSPLNNPTPSVMASKDLDHQVSDTYAHFCHSKDGLIIWLGVYDTH